MSLAPTLAPSPTSDPDLGLRSGPALAPLVPSPPEVPTVEWGARVAEARRLRRLSQGRLAAMCGVSQQTISKVEHGEICPHDRLKLALALALEVPPAALFPWPIAV